MNKMETTSAQSTGSQPSVTGNSAPEPAAPRSQQAEPLNVIAALKTIRARAHRRWVQAREAKDGDASKYHAGFVDALDLVIDGYLYTPEKAEPAGNTALSNTCPKGDHE